MTLHNSFVRLNILSSRDGAIGSHKHQQQRRRSSSANTKSANALHRSSIDAESIDANELYDSKKKNHVNYRNVPISTPSSVSTPGTESQTSQMIPKRWVPKLKRKSGLFTSFTKRNDHSGHSSNHLSSHALNQTRTSVTDDDSPSSSKLSNVAAVSANEYLNECLFINTTKGSSATAASGFLDRRKWESIPQYYKSDLLVRKHLGKGSFSDAFEVSVMVTVEEKSDDLSEKDDLVRLIDAKFPDQEIEDDEEEKDDLDKEIDAMFAAAPTVPKKPVNFQPYGLSSRRPGCTHHLSMNQYHRAFASSCVHKAQASTRPVQRKRMTYAMKCLRPQIRSNADQFIIGVEDLVHETAILASLDHPNIIKLHGRAISDSFRLSDGYFILLDRLQDTLEDRIIHWRISAAMGERNDESQFAAACSIVDAMSYLHSKNIVFRDLKPANVGFDSQGVLKLFDFGFAIGVKNDSDLLHGVSGTPRYMAPEVALEHGYSLPVDVHSFGILLWEITSLKKPFGHLESKEEFHESVFRDGMRPKLAKGWSQCLKDIMSRCWCVEAGERLTMEVVAKMLRAHATHQNKNCQLMKNSTMCLRWSITG